MKGRTYRILWWYWVLCGGVLLICSLWRQQSKECESFQEESHIYLYKMAFDVISCTLIVCMNIVSCLMQLVDIPQQPKSPPVKEANKPVSSDNGAVILKSKILSNAAAVISSTTTTTTKAPSPPSNSNVDSYIESGAVMRGVFVFVGLTLLFIMYLVFKTYRKGNKKQVAIKKYGVRARRTDTEMEPLHLDDEDEDETLFVRSASTR